MASPFPGMDPYLENPEIFPDFHDSVISYLREASRQAFQAPYFAALGRRVWIEVSRRSIGPDVEMRQRQSAGRPHSERRAAGGLAVVNLRSAALSSSRSPTTNFASHSSKSTCGATKESGSSARSRYSVYSNKTPANTGVISISESRKRLFASKVHLVEIDLLRRRRACDGGSA